MTLVYEATSTGCHFVYKKWGPREGRQEMLFHPFLEGRIRWIFWNGKFELYDGSIL